jgi:hypothetical protein
MAETDIMSDCPELPARQFCQNREDLWRKRNPEGILRWVMCAIKSGTWHSINYRIFAAETDIDADLGKAAEFFSQTSVNGVMAERHAQYVLRLMWRFLLRNIAICDSCRVSAVLREWGEPWYWTLWRLKDRLLLRLLAGVATGFLVLSASSGLLSILGQAAACQHWPWLWLILIFSVATVYLLACSEVERRVGRRPFWVILRRGAYITVLGVLYACVGGVIQYFGAQNLGLGRFAPARFCVVSASTALVLGFVLQLFWEERALGDPL